MNILSKIDGINNSKTTNKNFYVILISFIISRINMTSGRMCSFPPVINELHGVMNRYGSRCSRDCC